MKFTCTIDIDLPREKVVELYKDSSNLKEWQNGFQSAELISEKINKVSAKSLLKFKNGKKRTMDLEETILVSDFPNEFTGEYVHFQMTNTMRNIFTEIDENTTRWTANIAYTQFNSLSIRVIIKLFPKMFKKQSQKWLDQFKVFAESKK